MATCLICGSSISDDQACVICTGKDTYYENIMYEQQIQDELLQGDIE
ncbi:hypothetical protein HN682_07695 [Candidatus Peregrinibacteria bacterium]|nr:hypothetical protein [Candidatus Peregrinibacteria bacterium]